MRAWLRWRQCESLLAYFTEVSSLIADLKVSYRRRAIPLGTSLISYRPFIDKCGSSILERGQHEVSVKYAEHVTLTENRFRFPSSLHPKCRSCLATSSVCISKSKSSLLSQNIYKIRLAHCDRMADLPRRRQLCYGYHDSGLNRSE